METIQGPQVVAALQRVSDRMVELRDLLNRLDAALGDGDTGITVGKIAGGIQAYVTDHAPGEDFGQFFISLGMAVNQAASSSLGTLIATAFMRAGKESQGLAALDGAALVHMLRAADAGMQQRGKAQPGGKTIIDAVHPATEAFATAIEQGKDLSAAAAEMLKAARAGRDSVIPLRSRVGRASWVGERTEGQPDPGTVLFVQMLEAVLQAPFTEPGSTLD